MNRTSGGDPGCKLLLLLVFCSQSRGGYFLEFFACLEKSENSAINLNIYYFSAILEFKFFLKIIFYTLKLTGLINFVANFKSHKFFLKISPRKCDKLDVFIFFISIFKLKFHFFKLQFFSCSFGKEFRIFLIGNFINVSKNILL